MERKKRLTVLPQKKKVFIFLLSLIYHLDLFDEKISSRRFSRLVLMFFIIGKDDRSDATISEDTLAHYIRRRELPTGLDVDEVGSWVRGVFEG